jgi:hypothetical protein
MSGLVGIALLSGGDACARMLADESLALLDSGGNPWLRSLMLA